MSQKQSSSVKPKNVSETFQIISVEFRFLSRFFRRRILAFQMRMPYRNHSLEIEITIEPTMRGQLGKCGRKQKVDFAVLCSEILFFHRSAKDLSSLLKHSGKYVTW